MAPNVSFSLYKSIQVCPGKFVRLLWVISRIPQHIILCLLPSPSLSLSSPLYSSSPAPSTVQLPVDVLLWCTFLMLHSVTPTAADAVEVGDGEVWQWWIREPHTCWAQDTPMSARRQQALPGCLHCNNCVTFAESGVQSAIERICTSSWSHACLVKLDQTSERFEVRPSLIINVWLW